jgi:hypothetical protein
MAAKPAFRFLAAVIATILLVAMLLLAPQPRGHKDRAWCPNQFLKNKNITQSGEDLVKRLSHDGTTVERARTVWLRGQPGEACAERLSVTTSGGGGRLRLCAGGSGPMLWGQRQCLAANAVVAYDLVIKSRETFAGRSEVAEPPEATSVTKKKEYSRAVQLLQESGRKKPLTAIFFPRECLSSRHKQKTRYTRPSIRP